MTDLCKPVPPPLAAPFPPSEDLRIVKLTDVQDNRPTESEYDKNGIIIEGMDECTSTRRFVVSRPGFIKLIKHRELGARTSNVGNHD